MDPRKREIDSLESEIARLEQQIGGECAAIGRYISDLNEADPGTPEIVKYLQSIRTLRKSEVDFQADIARLRETTRKVGELEASAADHERRSRDLERELERRHLDLGAGSYRAYKTLAAQGDKDRYRAYFEDLLKLDVEIARLEEELKSIEEEEKRAGLFDRLRSAGRKILLRGSMSRIEKQKLKAYADAGAKVAGTDFGDRTDGELRTLFDFAADKQRVIGSLQDQGRRLRADIARLEEVLQRYGVSDDPDLQIRELERRIADVKREQDVIYSWVGQLFLDKDLRREFADSSLSAKYEIVHGMRQGISRKRAQIHRLKAELEIEELEKKDKALRQRRKQLEEEMKVRERQISVVDLEISTGERRIDHLKKVITGEAPYTDAPPLPPTPDFYSRKPADGPPAP